MITIVSGYWKVKNKNNNSFYENIFKKTLPVNCPYIFFTPKNNNDLIKKYRNNSLTHFVNFTLNDFYTNKFKFSKIYIHNIHVPSIELGKIWLEKIFLLRKAKELNIYNSEWYAWNDAGNSYYRRKKHKLLNKIWPNINKINILDKKKINFTISIEKYYKKLKKKDVLNGRHFVSGTYVIHKNLIDEFCNVFEKYINIMIKKTKNKKKYVCLSDQCILTMIYIDKPELFNCIGKGYGVFIKLLS